MVCFLPRIINASITDSCSINANPNDVPEFSDFEDNPQRPQGPKARVGQLAPKRAGNRRLNPRSRRETKGHPVREETFLVWEHIYL